jgi:hypothetical protein
MTTTRYQAYYNGKLVGERATKSHTYSHAYVVQRDEARERAKAYDRTVTADDRKTYTWHADRILRGVGAPFWPNDAYLAHIRITAEDIANARRETEGGLDGYVARQRQAMIDRFEDERARGRFAPRVGGWASRADLAVKQGRAYVSNGGIFLGIVPAVPKPSTKKT